MPKSERCPVRQSNAETGVAKAATNTDGRTMPGEVMPNAALESIAGGHE